MTHLTPDELIDATEGLLAAGVQAHLEACDECRAQLAALSMTLSGAKEAGVPEPSPLFWQHFSARVTTAIQQDATRGTNRLSWLRWQIFVPLGAVAMIIVAMAMNIPKREVPGDVVDNTSPAVEQADDTWVMVSQLVGDIDLDTASAAGVIEPGVAEEAVLHLTAEEQQELTRLLKAELQRAKS